ncbi:MAG: hypothetical protein M3R70_05630 [Actinomycetota bacterium]|nr:hypothetical protein [Actinomycetota bacterium]
MPAINNTRVGNLKRVLEHLVAERQRLRADGSCDPVALERNRSEIVRRQQELGHALIELHAQFDRAA